MAGQTASTVESAPEQRVRKSLRRWAFLAVVLAVVAVAAAFVVGIIGLTANPVKSVGAGGTATLEGTFEPYRCGPASCNGYIQAGARSVFVQFPTGCPVPPRGTTVTVSARRAPDLGTASYRALRCG
jgi:hypothetical protein